MAQVEIEGVTIDLDALRQRYADERAKRLGLRPQGNGQYVDMEGDFGPFADDPYVERRLERGPISRDVDVAIIGGGFGGQLIATRLQQAGVEDVCIIERGGDFGGTWYWNRYPGAMCDVDAYIYMPLLEELGYLPTQKYAMGDEIRAHSRRIGEAFGLYPKTLFQTEVIESRWNDATSRWIVSTDRGDRLAARFVASATGLLCRPKLPGIPGIESFRGHSFHTSRWDYGYTGGDANGGLPGLADKRVGLIGTGATAVQCVPHLAASSGELFVFQRTPSSIDVRNNRPTDPDWARSLAPGWQAHRSENFLAVMTGRPQDEDLIGDGWTDMITRLSRQIRRGKAGGEGLDPGKLAEMADYGKMEEIRQRVDTIVQDPATAEALKPYYKWACKRPCFHDEYLQAFNRPNVHLIDTAGIGVERIAPEGVVANGQLYQLDCLIFGTGFEWATDFSRRAGFETYGRGGLSLSETWSGGVRTLHGQQTRGFPNYLFINQSQAAPAPNFTYTLEHNAAQFAYIIAHCLNNGIRTAEVSADAEAAWVETIKAQAYKRLRVFKECTPGYLNNEGEVSETATQDAWYGDGPVAYGELLAAWRADGALEGLELTLG